jgi:hypothetical protein
MEPSNVALLIILIIALIIISICIICYCDCNCCKRKPLDSDYTRYLVDWNEYEKKQLDNN